jgi:tetratricopeptide (TPR) repeat protein
MTLSRSNSSRWFAPLIVLLIGVVAYSNSLTGPFIFDDAGAISLNPQIRSLIPYKLPSDGPTAISGRPVTIFTFAADYAISGLRVETYHVTNLLIHLLTAWLLYALLRRTFLRVDRLAQYSTWLAALTAAIWVAHPLDTASVTYIVQRSESLASLFLLATIYCVLRASTSSARWWGAAAIISCALGMGSKEIVVGAPVVALLYDRAFIAGSFNEAVKHRWKIYAGLCATWILILLSLHTGGRETMVGYHLGISPLDYARTELNVIARYFRLAFWPHDLVLDYYDWPIARNWSNVSWQGWLVLALALATIPAIYLKPRIGFLAAAFFLIVAPTSSILPIKHEAAADQRMYLPLAAIVVFVVVVGWTLLGRWKWSRISMALAGCAIVVCLARLTILRNNQYSTALDIWQDTVAKRPLNARARMNLGEAWAQLSIDFPFGSPEAVAAATHAAHQYQSVLALEPSMTHAIFALGQSYEQMGDPRAAEDLYTQSLPNHPDIAADLYVERGNLRARRGDRAEAESDFKSAIAANPTDPEPHYFLSLLFVQKQDWNRARQELEKTVRLSPDYKDAAQLLAKMQKPPRQPAMQLNSPDRQPAPSAAPSPTASPSPGRSIPRP